MSRKKITQLVIIGGLGGIIAYYHFFIIDQLTPMHSLHYRLNYLPILLAAIWFGRIGGVLLSVLMTVVYLPHVIVGHVHDPYTGPNAYFEFVLYNVVGWLVGDLVTRRVRDQERLDNARRLASLGEIAAGIAHEIRNPVQTIGGAIDIVMKRPPGPLDEGARDLLKIAKEEVRRLDGFVRDFLFLSSPRLPRKVKTDMDLLLASTVDRVKLARGAACSSIEILKSRVAVCDHPLCDPDQIEQALRNLVENALDAALAASASGKVRVFLQELPTGDGASPEAVSIHVEDSGVGIEPGDREAVFEPFRTWKSGGTGLGLPLARRIAEAHGGSLTVGSSSLGGAAFVLTIPSQSGVPDQP